MSSFTTWRLAGRPPWSATDWWRPGPYQSYHDYGTFTPIQGSFESSPSAAPGLRQEIAPSPQNRHPQAGWMVEVPKGLDVHLGQIPDAYLADGFPGGSPRSCWPKQRCFVAGGRLRRIRRRSPRALRADRKRGADRQAVPWYQDMFRTDGLLWKTAAISHKEIANSPTSATTSAARAAEGQADGGAQDHQAEHRQPGRVRLRFAGRNPAGHHPHPPNAAGYTDSRASFAARKAIMHYTQQKGIKGVTLDDIYVGNGSSELIVMAMNALLDAGDEVLVPAPDYPLWTAAISLVRRHAQALPVRRGQRLVARSRRHPAKITPAPGPSSSSTRTTRPAPCTPDDLCSERKSSPSPGSTNLIIMPTRFTTRCSTTAPGTPPSPAFRRMC